MGVGGEFGGECVMVAASFGFGEGLESFREAVEFDERQGLEKPSDCEARV